MFSAFGQHSFQILAHIAVIIFRLIALDLGKLLCVHTNLQIDFSRPLVIITSGERTVFHLRLMLLEKMFISYLLRFHSSVRGERIFLHFFTQDQTKKLIQLREQGLGHHVLTLMISL